ncbi:response regulator [Thermoplasmatales archaeon ex4484_36]|nr:MAG: response regulator [Thermoplasmatales archaeon ex4484_36]
MDDQEAVLDSTSLLLKELGFEVETARNGQEAIERYKRALEEGEAFHAVVMDLTVPGGMGGKEAIKRLKEIDPNVRAIVYTGYSNDPILSSFREYGFSGALKKPFKALQNRGAYNGDQKSRRGVDGIRSPKRRQVARIT